MTSRMAKLGSLQKRLDLAEEANKGLIGSTTSGIGKLVDADMETVSTRMTALQTQQQLAIQSLNIADQAPQAMLRCSGKKLRLSSRSPGRYFRLK